MTKRSKMNDAERLAWALHTYADLQEEISSRRCRGESTGERQDHLEIAMRCALKARIVLRDKFGLNLDTVYDKARGGYDELWEEARKEIEAERARLQEGLEATARADELIARALAVYPEDKDR